MTEKIELSLSPKTPADQPIIGYFAVGFGILGIFTHAVVFVPLAVICSIVALFKKQIIWGVMGLLLAFMGIITSPAFMMFLGLRMFLIYLNSVYDWMGMHAASVLPEV